MSPSEIMAAVFGNVADGMSGIQTDVLTVIAGGVGCILIIAGLRAVSRALFPQTNVEREGAQEEIEESWKTGWRSKYDRDEIEGGRK